MKKLAFVLVLTACIVLPTKLLAWGSTGHRVIAEIAERNLSKKAEKGVKELLDGQHMAYWANWADFVKSDTTGKWKHTGVWHYVNTPANMSKDDFIHFLNHNTQESAYSVIPMLIAKVKNKELSKAERKEALVFLIHVAGDFHQPMHSGRAEDRGGNDVKIKWFGRDTNLHSLWDTAIVDFEKYSYTEYATVLNIVTDEQVKEIQMGTIDDWFYDVHQIANKLYAETPNGSELSYRYNYDFRHVVEGQLQKGGLRLAKILDEIFD